MRRIFTRGCSRGVGSGSRGPRGGMVASLLGWVCSGVVVCEQVDGGSFEPVQGGNGAIGGACGHALAVGVNLLASIVKGRDGGWTVRIR